MAVCLRKRHWISLQVPFTFIEIQICEISSIGESGHFLGVRFTQFLKVLEVSFVTLVAGLYFKTALYGLIRKPLKDSVTYGFDLHGRNAVRVTAKKVQELRKLHQSPT